MLQPYSDRIKGIIHDNYPFWVALHAVLAIGILWAMQKPFFHPNSIDGFSTGINIVKGLSWETWQFRPLPIVHLMRYIITFPWWWVRESELAPLLNAIMIVGLTVPTVMIPLDDSGKRPSPLRVAFLYLACIFSMRGVLVSIGACYIFLVIYSNCRSRILYALSAFFVNLSSAGVLLWLLMHACNYTKVKSLLKNHLRIIGVLILAIMIFSITASIFAKLRFFEKEIFRFTTNINLEQNQRVPDEIFFIDRSKRFKLAPHEKSRVVKDFVSELFNIKAMPTSLGEKTVLLVAAIADRNTVLSSYYAGDYLRSVTYILLFLLYLYCLGRIYRHIGFHNSLFVFYTLSGFVFFMEGLGVMSLLLLMGIIILERRRLIACIPNKESQKP